MLIVSRRQLEQVQLGNGVTLTIVKVAGEKVRIGVKAPPNLKVLRKELHDEEQPSTSDIAKFRRAA